MKFMQNLFTARLNTTHFLNIFLIEIFLISGLSKAYAMTGWRLGYIAAPKQIMKSIRKINSFLVTSVTDNVQIAAVEALNNGQNDPKEARKIYEARLTFMQSGLEKLGFEMATPQGAFYIFAKIPEKYGTDDEQFAFELAQKLRSALLLVATLVKAVKVTYVFPMLHQLNS